MGESTGDLENPILPIDTESVEVRSLRLDLASAEAEIDRLRELTASLTTRLTTLERSQNADSMKHEGAATALATLTERIKHDGAPRRCRARAARRPQRATVTHCSRAAGL